MTEAGHILLPWARRLLHNMDEIEDMMASLQEVAVGELHMMYGTAIGKYILPQLATRFCLLYPKIKVRILASNPQYNVKSAGRCGASWHRKHTGERSEVGVSGILLRHDRIDRTGESPVGFENLHRTS